MCTFIITRENNNDELKHYGVLGMKWGKRKAQYYESTGGRSIKSKSNQTNSTGSAEQKLARRKKAVKVGAAVVGTALAAYGTYKIAQHVSNKRNQAAMQKARSYIDENFMKKIGTSKFTNGKTASHYQDGLGNNFVLYGRGDKTIGKNNAKVISTGRQMYKDATNTKLDKGLNKIVTAGNKVGKATEPYRDLAKAAGEYVKVSGQLAGMNAKEAATKTGRNVKNHVLDVVKPQYETVNRGGSTFKRQIKRTLKYM